MSGWQQLKGDADPVLVITTEVVDVGTAGEPKFRGVELGNAVQLSFSLRRRCMSEVYWMLSVGVARVLEAHRHQFPTEIP
jgi:hypothetical protein